MKKLLLILRSARHLKAAQIFGRVGLLLRRKVLQNTSFYMRRFEASSEDVRLVEPIKFSPNHHRANIPALEQRTFTFLNQTVHLGQPVEWHPTNVSQLWAYNLHYFDYASALANSYHESHDFTLYQVWRELVIDWIDGNRLGSKIAWDPYTSSLRIVNWLRAYGAFNELVDQDPQFNQKICLSLYQQALFLEENIEYHLLGNHLIENGRALLYSGIFFKTKAAKRWLKKGQSILWAELKEEFLEDGGHYELSPMYHLILQDVYTEVFEVASKNNVPVPQYVEPLLAKMDAWIRELTHPDGEIALLNDAAFGIARKPDQKGPSSNFVPLESSGYFIFSNVDLKHKLIFDAGQLGPTYQPGHGHCDLLSFELSLFGERMIVDSGVGNYYGDIEFRNYYRSTRAHNTIEVNHLDQSEIWDRFRVGNRALPQSVQWDHSDPHMIWAMGSHTGYRQTLNEGTHTRWIGYIGEKFWIICDHISGAGEHEINSFLHLHPDCAVSIPEHVTDDALPVRVTKQTSSLQIFSSGYQQITIQEGCKSPIQGWYSPEFGIYKPNPTLTYQYQGSVPTSKFFVIWPGDDKLEVNVTDKKNSQFAVEVQNTHGNYSMDLDIQKARFLLRN